MSLASLGTRKYGRSGSFDSYSVGGEIEEDGVSEQVLVRHIPIVIEEDESEFDDKIDK